MLNELGHQLVILAHYIAEFELLESDFTIYGLVVASLVAYFGFMASLNEALSTIGSSVKGKMALNRLNAIQGMAKVLRALSVVSGVLLIANVANAYAVIVPNESASSYRIVVKSAIGFWTPITVVFLTISGFLTANLVYHFKKEDAENTCCMWEAVVHLTCGRVLRGTIDDLSFLTNVDLHLALCRKDLTLDVVALSDVAAIFLQPEYAGSESIRRLTFIGADRVLTMTAPHVEVLPAKRHFVGERFTVLDLDKPTTSARFAVVQSQYLQEL